MRSETEELERAMLEQLESRPDYGFWRRIGNLLFEPRNPFEPDSKRSPKKDVVVMGMLLLLALLLVGYFNLTAVR